MKLASNITTERGKPLLKTANEFILHELTVNREPVGEIELYVYNDIKEHGADTNEWLLKYRATPDDYWQIIAQGNIKA